LQSIEATETESELLETINKIISRFYLDIML